MDITKRKSIVLIAILFSCIFLTSNIKPISASNETNQIYWGAWVGNSHIGNYNLLTNFEGQVGKGVSIWNWIQLWNRPQDSENIPNFDTALMNQARNHGVIPMVSWGPESGNPNFPFNNLKSIIDGSQDAYLIKWGQDSAKWGHPYFVRLMWEFTGSWTYDKPSKTGIYPWGENNSPQLFVQAWQHVVDTVRASGGTQISWVWCTGDVGDSVSALRSVYPGDSYVDWVGTDIYVNQGQTFDQAAQPELNNIRTVAPNKPVMIPETAYVGADSSNYWNNLLTNVLPNSYSYVKAIVIWEMPSGGFTVLDSKTLSSFGQAILSSYYSPNAFSNLNNSPIDNLRSTGENPNPNKASTSPIGNSDHSVHFAPTVAAVSVTVVVIIVGIGLLVFFKKIKR
jgi:hypothetical protein